MTRASVIRQLVTRTKGDFLSYFSPSKLAASATQFVEWAEAGDLRLVDCVEKLEAMLPDTEDDGSWEASYALNAGCIILSLIDYEGGSEQAYGEAVTSFFDSVDFKVQQALEAAGVSQPTEKQIADHPLMAGERAWFKQIQGGGS